MKTLTVSALLWAIWALTAAAAPSDEVAPIHDAPSDEVAPIHDERQYSCPEGWTLVIKRCFRYIPREMSWANAEKNCLSMGANLASVHSAEEYHGIKKMLLDQTHGYPVVWIGGSDSEEEGFWFWSDGSPFDYVHWCSGEPNNVLQQNCLQMNHNDEKCWDDQKCPKHRGSVCASSTYKAMSSIASAFLSVSKV